MSKHIDFRISHRLIVSVLLLITMSPAASPCTSTSDNVTNDISNDFPIGDDAEVSPPNTIPMDESDGMYGAKRECRCILVVHKLSGDDIE